MCIAGAVGMTLFCVFKYFKNESIVSVSYKVFHDTPDDVYPSISICLGNKKFGPFVDTNNISAEDISDMMKGLTKYNQSLLKNITYEDMTIRLPVERLEYLRIEEDLTFKEPCVDSKCFNPSGDGRVKCFTHDLIFTEGIITKRLTIKITKTKQIMEADMIIYFHHPGQLFRNGNDPVLEGISHKTANRFLFNVQSVTILRKRKAGKGKCSSASFDDDKNLFENEIQKYSCSTNYKGQYLYDCNIDINNVS